MRRWTAWVLMLLGVIGTGGGGLISNTDAEKNWMGDYKTLERYGMTSDKHLYGNIIPTGRTRGTRHKQIASQASDADSLGTQSLDSIAVSHQESFLFHAPNSKAGDQHATRQGNAPNSYKQSTDSKPLYDDYYTKYLESLGNEQFFNYPRHNFGEIKPKNHKYTNSNTYKSIQDILNSQECSSHKTDQRNVPNENSEHVKYRSAERASRKKPPGKVVYNRALVRNGNKCTSVWCRRGLRPVGPAPRRVKHGFFKDHAY